jgi:hypothetical protein
MAPRLAEGRRQGYPQGKASPWQDGLAFFAAIGDHLSDEFKSIPRLAGCLWATPPGGLQHFMGINPLESPHYGTALPDCADHRAMKSL